MKQLADVSVKSMENVQSMAMVFGAAEPGQPLFQGLSSTMRVTDSEAFLDQYAETVKSMAELSVGAKQSPFTNMTTTPIDVAGHKGLEVTMDVTPFYENPQIVRFAPLLKAMYGPENNLKIYLAAADKTTVVFNYIDKEGAVRAVEAATQSGSSLAADARIAAVAKRLPEGSQWLGFWSPRGTVQLVQQAIDALAPDGSGVTLPEFPETPPVAFAAKVSSTEARKELLIPVEVLKAVPEYIGQLKKMRQFAMPEEEL